MSTRLRKPSAVVATAAVLLLLTTACFPNVAPGEPADPSWAALYRAINQDRAAAGLPPLSHSPKLTNQAGTWSWQMAMDNSLRHQDLAGLLHSPDYQAFFTLGENILVAPGHYTPDQLDDVWMNSPPHRAHILSRSFNVVGVGVFRGPDGRLWATADFGGL